jgi:hypothetical protein
MRAPRAFWATVVNSKKFYETAVKKNTVVWVLLYGAAALKQRAMKRFSGPIVRCEINGGSVLL